MAKLPSLVAVVILSTPWQAQTPTYAKGDTVRLMVPPDADALPDSTVIAVPGDRIQTKKSEVLVNGQPVARTDVQRQQFAAVGHVAISQISRTTRCDASSAFTPLGSVVRD